MRPSKQVDFIQFADYANAYRDLNSRMGKNDITLAKKIGETTSETAVYGTGAERTNYLTKSVFRTNLLKDSGKQCSGH